MPRFTVKDLLIATTLVAIWCFAWVYIVTDRGHQVLFYMSGFATFVVPTIALWSFAFRKRMSVWFAVGWAVFVAINAMAFGMAMDYVLGIL